VLVLGIIALSHAEEKEELATAEQHYRGGYGNKNIWIALDNFSYAIMYLQL